MTQDISVPNNRPMGRPALNMEAMILRLPKETKERIDKIVGEKRRAVFIREAIDRELERREKSND